MHKRKVIHVSNQLKSINSKDGKVKKISPPILTGLDEERVRKLIEPLQTYVEEDEEKEESNRSNSPSPRQSVCGFETARIGSQPEETILKILVIGKIMIFLYYYFNFTQKKC